ncbi:MAG: sulfatase, partial [Lentisphaerae bacterium]
MTQKKNDRVNVIWIFGDQHRGQALSCNGDPNARTPHLDRLAAEGLNITGAVSGFPLCCPFRGSMITGLYPHHCVPGHEEPLDPKQPTIAHVLRSAGYHTGYFGKWHLDGFKERNGRAAMHIIPPERRGGFDEWIGYEN